MYSPGISEPLPVAETFTFVEPISGRSLEQYARLDTLVTVVDGPAFLRDFSSTDLLITRNVTTLLTSLVTSLVTSCNLLWSLAR